MRIAPSSIADFGFYSLRSRGGTAEGAAGEVSDGIRRASRFGDYDRRYPWQHPCRDHEAADLHRESQSRAEGHAGKKTIAQSKQVNPDRRTNPAQTLDEDYEYIDWAARAMP